MLSITAVGNVTSDAFCLYLTGSRTSRMSESRQSLSFSVSANGTGSFNASVLGAGRFRLNGIVLVGRKFTVGFSAQFTFSLSFAGSRTANVVNSADVISSVGIVTGNTSIFGVSALSTGRHNRHGRIIMLSVTAVGCVTYSTDSPSYTGDFTARVTGSKNNVASVSVIAIDTGMNGVSVLLAGGGNDRIGVIMFAERTVLTRTVGTLG